MIEVLEFVKIYDNKKWTLNDICLVAYPVLRTLGFPDGYSCSSRTVLPVPLVSLLNCHDIKDPDTRMLFVNAVENGKTPSHMQAIHNIPLRKV